MLMKKTKLIYKILLFTLPLLILSIIITGLVLSWTNYNYFMKTIDMDYRNILKSSAGEFRLFMKNAQQGLEGLALVMGATKLDKWQKEMALTAFNHTAAQFMSVSLISLQRDKIVSTDLDGDDATLGQNEIFEKSLSIMIDRLRLNEGFARSKRCQMFILRRKAR